jgi:hypothetical protein
LITNENSFLFEIKIGIDTVMDFPPVVFFNITTTMTITNSLNSSSIFISIFIGICMSLIALITALGNIVTRNYELLTVQDLIFYINYSVCFLSLKRLFYIKYGCCWFSCRFFLHTVLYSIQVSVTKYLLNILLWFSITQSWPFGRLFCKIWVNWDDWFINKSLM